MKGCTQLSVFIQYIIENKTSSVASASASSCMRWRISCNSSQSTHNPDAGDKTGGRTVQGLYLLREKVSWFPLELHLEVLEKQLVGHAFPGIVEVRCASGVSERVERAVWIQQEIGEGFPRVARPAGWLGIDKIRVVHKRVRVPRTGGAWMNDGTTMRQGKKKRK